MPPTTTQRARFVIPPGQEAVIARMLNPPAGLDGGWRFTRAAIQSHAIHGYYEGPGGEKAHMTLKARADAPPKWGRTERFAVGLAANPGPSAMVLYRALMAAVRAAESGFAWREVDTAATSGPDPDLASRERAAEDEVDLHLDHTPFVDLGIEFDHR